MKRIQLLKTLSESCALAVVLLPVMLVLPLAAESESDDARAQRETAELQDAQAQMAKAYGDYYQALRKAPKSADLDALQQQTLGASQGRMVSLLGKRHNESQKMIYNKAYLADGTVVDADLYKKNPKAYAQDDGDDVMDFTGGSSGKRKEKTKVVQNGAGVPSSQSAFSGGGSGGDGSKRPEWVIDGTNVPKELSFPGGKSAKKRRAPASR